MTDNTEAIMSHHPLQETEHFFIQHCHWNRGDWRMYEYSIQPKANTRDSKAAIPEPVRARNAEDLIPHLHETETWYVENRRMVEKYAPKSTPAA
jgi:hypothetical protein